MDLHLKKCNDAMKAIYAVFLLVVITALTFIFSSATEKRDCPVAPQVFLVKQNVLYIGVDNPVTISIPGVNPSNLIVSVSSGTVTESGRPGYYIIRVTEGHKIFLTVNYRKLGSEVSAGTFEFRIKKIPDPVAYVNAIRHEGMMQKADLQTLTGVFTRMENFDFDYAFKPESFSMSVIENGVWKEYTAQGPAITQEMKTALNNAKPEEKIIFHSIMTKGPDSAVRKVNDVVITVK